MRITKSRLGIACIITPLVITGGVWIVQARALNTRTPDYMESATGHRRLIDVPHPADGHLRPDDAFLSRRMPVAFDGVVIERLKSDGLFCGVLATYQGVRYRITNPIAGGISTREVVVFHALVGPPLCEKGAAELSREIFRVGNRLRVEAERTGNGVLVGWENPYTVEILQAL